MLPESRPWRLESEIPKPQKKPKMVIWEVTQYPPGAQPTPEQREAAKQLIERSERAAVEQDWENFDHAHAEGFRMLPGDRRHYYNREYILDDRILDPERPEFLMYYDAPEGKRLVGYMFYARTLTERGPQIGGPLTVWHYHVWSHAACLVRGVAPGGLFRDGPCPEGLVRTRRSPEMLHVWLIDRPNGPFSTSMFLPPAEVQQLLDDRARALRQVH